VRAGEAEAAVAEATMQGEEGAMVAASGAVMSCFFSQGWPRGAVPSLLGSVKQCISVDL
jgi:hypothetical protein